jgi:hypothetical protein
MLAQRCYTAEVLAQNVRSILFDQNSTQHRTKTFENTPLFVLGCQSHSLSSVMYVVGHLASDQLPFHMRLPGSARVELRDKIDVFY